jgi:hypothetical protein
VLLSAWVEHVEDRFSVQILPTVWSSKMLHRYLQEVAYFSVQERHDAFPGFGHEREARIG